MLPNSRLSSLISQHWPNQSLSKCNMIWLICFYSSKYRPVLTHFAKAMHLISRMSKSMLATSMHAALIIPFFGNGNHRNSVNICCCEAKRTVPWCLDTIWEYHVLLKKFPKSACWYVTIFLVFWIKRSLCCGTMALKPFYLCQYCFSNNLN